MHELRIRLLASGISPAAVERYLQELGEHREDLVCELIASGMSAGDAEAAADRRLGDEATLAQPMLDDPRFRSLAARAPVLFWVGLPAMSQAALVAALAVAVVLAARSGLESEMLAGAIRALLFVAPLGLAWSFTRLAARRHVLTGWPIAGAGLTIILGSSLRLDIAPTDVAVSLAAPDALQLAAYALLGPCRFSLPEPG
jgi:hypothetical protein